MPGGPPCGEHILPREGESVSSSLPPPAGQNGAGRGPGAPPVTDNLPKPTP